MIGELKNEPQGVAREAYDARYLVVENAVMTFETRKGTFVALQNINLDIPKGMFGFS